MKKEHEYEKEEDRDRHSKEGNESCNPAATSN